MSALFREVTDKRLPISRSRGGTVKDLSPLRWDLFFEQQRLVPLSDGSMNVYTKGSNGQTVFLLLHGGGYSALTWSCLTEELTSLCDCRIIAPDLRGHGQSDFEDEIDLSLDRQVMDVIALCRILFEGETETKLIIVGHSMGGAVAVHSAKQLANVVGLVVIDVVEGTAMAALSSMRSFLSNRPQSFTSEENAIAWCLHSGTVHNARSARVSMPGQLKQTPDQTFTWRIDLAQTQPHWSNWFAGLSRHFLECPMPKLLVLAGMDRLDKDLTVGQMQGKFQMIVLQKVGHAVQEDSPKDLAVSIVAFAVRQRLVTAKADYTAPFPAC